MPDAIDQTKADAFCQKMFGVLNQAALAQMTSIGHRVGLFDAMSRLPALHALYVDVVGPGRSGTGGDVGQVEGGVDARRGRLSARRGQEPGPRPAQLLVHRPAGNVRPLF